MASEFLTPIKQRLQVARDYVDAAPLRQRILFFILCLVVVNFVWYVMFLSPLSRTAEKTEVKIKEVSSEMLVLQAKVKGITAKLQEAYTQSESLKTDITKVEKEIDVLGESTVPTEKIAGILWNSIRQSKSLKLLELKGLTLQPMVESRQLSATRYQLFKQPLELSFTGDYFHTVNYLQELEALKHPIFWEKLVYDVEQYPKARVSLELYTLSAQHAGGAA